jgi:hypothetical protein
VVVALVALAASAAAARSRVVINGAFTYKPHEFAVSGDGDFLVRGLRWRSWGGKTAVAFGQAVEQVRPSHVDHTYPVRVTLSHRKFCPNLHRRVYNKIVARILGPNPGVFGTRALGRVYTCSGSWRLVSPHVRRAPRMMAATCSTHGLGPAPVSINTHRTSCARARKLLRQWFRKVKVPGQHCTWRDGSARPGVCRVHGWLCRDFHTVNGQTNPLVCTTGHGRRRVRFVNRV